MPKEQAKKEKIGVQEALKDEARVKTRLEKKYRIFWLIIPGRFLFLGNMTPENYQNRRGGKRGLFWNTAIALESLTK